MRVGVASSSLVVCVHACMLDSALSTHNNTHSYQSGFLLELVESSKICHSEKKQS